MPSYEVVSPLSLYQPINKYPAFVGLANVFDSLYIFVKLSLTPLGNVPPLVLYFIVYVAYAHFAYIFTVTPSTIVKSLSP